jgi:hypothetical protein
LAVKLKFAAILEAIFPMSELIQVWVDDFFPNEPRCPLLLFSKKFNSSFRKSSYNRRKAYTPFKVSVKEQRNSLNENAWKEQFRGTQT